MKALTLTAPYGTLIALAEQYPKLGKHIETRSWSTRYRGPLAIHQAKGLGPVGGKRGLVQLIAMLSAFEIDELCAAFAAGDTNRSRLARLYGVSRITVWRHLRDRGLL